MSPTPAWRTWRDAPPTQAFQPTFAALTATYALFLGSITFPYATAMFAHADLHTRSYEQILAGRGFGLDENRCAIEAVSAIRTLLMASVAIATFAAPVLAQEDVIRIGLLGGENESDRLADNQCLIDKLPAALGVKESAHVLELILKVRDSGIPVILISHNMPHVFEVADRIHIHRLGRRIAVISPKTHSMNEAVAIMTGAMKPPAAGETAPNHHYVVGEEVRPN